MIDDRGQMTGVMGRGSGDSVERKTDDGGRTTEDRRQKTEDGRQYKTVDIVDRKRLEVREARGRTGGEDGGGGGRSGKEGGGKMDER